MTMKIVKVTNGTITPEWDPEEEELWVGDKDFESYHDNLGDGTSHKFRTVIEHYNELKSKMLQNIFQDSFDIQDGPKSKQLFNNLQLTVVRRNGKINGAKTFDNNDGKNITSS